MTMSLTLLWERLATWSDRVGWAASLQRVLSQGDDAKPKKIKIKSSTNHLGFYGQDKHVGVNPLNELNEIFNLCSH